MAVTIEDVAHLAGCSKTTVSRTFVLPGKVKEETRQRVLRAAEQLHYSPNAIARAMVTQRNYNTAFILYEKHFPITINPFYAAVYEAVHAEAERNGYGVLASSSRAVAQGETDLLMRKRVDGVIFAGQTDTDILFDLHAQGIPVVLVNNDIEGSDIVSIRSDEYGGTQQAVRHLIARGHRRIGMLSGQLFPYISEIRLRAFRETMLREGLPVDERYVYSIPATREAAIDTVTRMLAQPDRPTALFCNNDTTAVGAIKAALRAGLRVPDDLAVVGFDGSSVCTVIEPELTSVAVDTARMGRLAAASLIRMLNGETIDEQRVQLAARLVVRGSS